MEVFAAECEADPDKNSAFEAACRMSGKQETKVWAPQLCYHKRVSSVSAAVVLWGGLRPAEFAERFEVTPASLGLKVTDLLGPDTSLFKRVLARDDGRFGTLGIQYEHKVQIEVGLQEDKLCEDSRIREDQCMGLFQYYTSPSQEEPAMMNKIRIGGKTVKEVMEAISEKEAGGSKHEADGMHDDDDDGSDHDGSDGSQHNENATVMSAYNGPSIKSSGLAGAASPETPKLKKDRSFVGAPSEIASTRRETATDADSDTDDDDGAAKKIKGICLVTILVGSNRLGHKRRRLKEHAKHLAANRDDIESVVLACRFTDKLSLGRHRRGGEQPDEHHGHGARRPNLAQQGDPEPCEAMAGSCSRFSSPAAVSGVWRGWETRQALLIHRLDRALVQRPGRPRRGGLLYVRTAPFEDHFLNFFVTPLMKCAASTPKATIVADLGAAADLLVASPAVLFSADRE